MTHNRELGAYQKMLGLMFKLNQSKDPRAIKIPISKFLKIVNKYWTKYHAKEFRRG